MLCSALHGVGRSRGDISEGFEQGAKRQYASGVIQLATGPWLLDQALIGRSGKDKKSGHAALRMKPGGSAAMGYTVVLPATAISFRHASFGTDKPARISLWHSSDHGVTWKKLGPTWSATASVATATIRITGNGSRRFKIRNEGPSRVNIDDFRISGAGSRVPAPQPTIAVSVPMREDNMALGNPSNAVASPSARNNYLLARPQYTLSYNHEKGIANWISWHLGPAWRGDAPRCNCFFSDPAIPTGLFRATTSDYSGSGFDRGHLCPSEDRDASTQDNAATFLMSNIAPQAPRLNQHPWARLEEFCRGQAGRGKELYIIAGSYGVGGVGSKGPARSIAKGRITVPARFWKIIVVLPDGKNDLQRINTQTMVIAVDMPNDQSAGDQSWGQFLTSVSAIEQATGYRFFSRLPEKVSKALKAKVFAPY